MSLVLRLKIFSNQCCKTAIWSLPIVSYTVNVTLSKLGAAATFTVSLPCFKGNGSAVSFGADILFVDSRKCSL